MTSAPMLQALAADLCWFPDVRAAVRSGLSHRALAAVILREVPRPLAAEEALLVADAVVELLSAPPVRTAPVNW